MKDTNAIEEALKKKVHDELWNIVDKFVCDCQHLSGKYGAESGFYNLEKGYPSNTSSTLHTIPSVRHGAELQDILVEMLKKSRGEKMLKIKTKELLNKLELL